MTDGFTGKHDAAGDFFREVEKARELGATSYSSGGRRVVFAGPPPPKPAREGVVAELDYAQTEQAVNEWLSRRGLDREVLEGLIRREEEAMSA